MAKDNKVKIEIDVKGTPALKGSTKAVKDQTKALKIKVELLKLQKRNKEVIINVKRRAL